MIIKWGAVLKAMNGSKVAETFYGVNVKKVGGHVKGFNPKRWGKGSTEKEGTNNIVSGPYHSFGFAILRRCIGTRVTEGNAIGSTKLLESIFDVFGAIIAL